MAGEKCAAGMTGAALIIVDVQRDFMPGGASPLVVPEMVIPAIAKAAKSFKQILILHEWQPDDLPGAICVAGDAGSESALPRWIFDKAGMVVRKRNGKIDNRPGMMMCGLRGLGICDVHVAGLNVDTSVLSVVVEALQQNMRAHVIRNGCADLENDEAKAALKKMQTWGARVFDLENV